MKNDIIYDGSIKHKFIRTSKYQCISKHPEEILITANTKITKSQILV